MVEIPQIVALIAGFVVIAADLLFWHLTPSLRLLRRTLGRVAIFLLFSWLIIAIGISPLQASPWSTDEVALNMLSTVLGVLWWLFAARTVTVVISAMFFSRVEHGARLFQDIIGAGIFLIAIVAAAGYVLQLPVKGLLATSGGMAIVGGLALRSTLSDLFSGIVLNTTKPYQVDDYVQIDSIEGRVVDIDWRATHLMTSMGSMAVIPNSIVANAKVLNLSRPADVHGVSIRLQVPAHVRPGRVIEALERAMQGTRLLLASHAPKASVKSSTLDYIEYEVRGFIASLSQHTEVSNQLFDLAHRHLEAAGIKLGNLPQNPSAQSSAAQDWTRQRLLLEEVKVFRSLSSVQRDQLAQDMRAVEYHAEQVVLELHEVADSLMIISTGVMSLAVHDGERLLEATRMGPGEVLGEEGILAEGRSRGQFRCITGCVLFRIDKATLRKHLENGGELQAALNKLQLYRQGVRQSLLLQKPVAIKKGGFLRWLKSA
ncbi:mechanosensitive ion channel domain-containing protein [Pseudomonas sp. NPDC090202]|uniref:mechanosensitive ion channel domain-containing protein n=1 Tax=unclassified Pseudomonas TaxID=196821 RepID=UPI0037F8ABE8